jgi:hypothetical protein
MRHLLKQLAKGLFNRSSSRGYAQFSGFAELCTYSVRTNCSVEGPCDEEVWLRGRLRSRIRAGEAEAGAKFADLFGPLRRIAVNRLGKRKPTRRSRADKRGSRGRNQDPRPPQEPLSARGGVISRAARHR